jgi:hypothetical protein
MGWISQFNLQQIINDFSIQHFVETGTGFGAGLAHAATFPFASLLSCEAHEGCFKHASGISYRRPVSIVHCGSVDFINEVVGCIPKDEPILFWLDAHFPGADFAGASFAAEPDADVRLPLHRELEAIAAVRPLMRDVILMDDARIYIDLAFGSGAVPDYARGACPDARNIDFIHEILAATHEVTVLLENEGYIQALPRKS